ncbi:DUF397 domain-containing protein [Streptomyces sp. BHT-5-2]|nr:DUF397 domain-containing protein [Streptomyces sp. BHT-5-2]
MTPRPLSSPAAADQSQCAEVADLADAPYAAIAVRDSKDPHSPTLAFSPGGWSAFVSAVRCEEFSV